MTDFSRAFDRVIGLEGGYVNSPGDPGGETKWGISKRSYPALNIKTLTREQAQRIYKRDFWDRLQLRTLPGSVVYQVFDFAVHSGIEVAVRYLQRAVGVADDGHWGPVSQAAASQLDEEDLILRFTAERLEFLTRLANWPNSGKGWVRRIAADLRYASMDL